MKKNLYLFLMLLICIYSGNVFGQSNPQILKPGFTINRIETVKNRAIRLDKDPVTNKLHYVLTNGNIYEVIRPTAGAAYDSLVDTASNHRVTYVQGMAFYDSTLYLSGNVNSDSSWTNGIIMRGKLQPNGTRSWDTLLYTQSYQTADYFDHLFSGLVVSPSGDSIYVCSGARGDHGEIQTRYGAFPGLRNVPMTTHIFSIPTSDPNTITLQNDSLWLANSGYVFSRGIRNTFDMAFDPNGNLFGVENSGDRDHNEEMNWLQRDHHYGFPWWMGDTENPQQFPSFNPAADSLISHYCRSWLQGFWNNDPAFPPPPGGLVFDKPMQNFGPDCDKFRDSLGNIHDASDSGISIGTFTGHRSPLGLVFDEGQILGSLYRGDGFMLSYTKGFMDSCGCTFLPDTAVGPYLDPSQDLVHLDLAYDAAVGNYRLNATRIIAEFAHPVDAEIDSNKIYVIETGGGGTSGLYEILLPVPQNACNPILSINLLAPCEPDSNTVVIPPFGLQPGTVSWFDSSGVLLQTDTGLTNSDTIFSLPSGGYYAIINDGGACVSDTISFSIPDTLAIVVDSVQNTTCIGCSDGIIYYHISGGTSPYLISGPTSGLMMGNYLLCVSDAGGCLSCDSAEIIDEPNLVAEISTGVVVSIFPNPADYHVTIHIDKSNGDKLSIWLINMNGRIDKIILNETLLPGKYDFTADLSNLANGCYTLEIMNGDRRSYKKLIVLK